MVKVGVIVPDRGDRPLFTQNLIRMINRQTFQPTLVNIVDDLPLSEDPDITRRYHIGYDWFRGMKMDVLAFMENDDWYSPDYLATIVSEWLKAGRPPLFGTTYTWYYHIRQFAYFKMTHLQRSSAMSTLIRPDMDVWWPQDSERYCDSHLYMVSGLKYKLFLPAKNICIGIKHGVGKSGGQNHNDRLDRYGPPNGIKDVDKEFLRRELDPESFEFYSNYFCKSGSAVV